MFKNKVAVITGASSGIGAIMAEQLSEQGAVPVLMARSLDKLNQVSAKIKGRHSVYQLDVTSTEQVLQTMELVYSEYGTIDILINNAGYGVFETFAEAKMEHFEQMMNVNYLGIVRCTKAALPYMQRAGSGHIVNIASMAGKIGSSKSTAYTASKHAVIGFTNSLRQELHNTGIYVSSVNPGPIDTPFFETADPSGSYVKNVKWFMLKPERVAKEVLNVIEKKRAEKDLPFVAGFSVKMYNLFPRLFDRIAIKIMNQK